jgi:nicotinamidase/pyrazinamidase
VFGVATEYCVRGAAKGLLERGRHVTVITDAIEAIDAKSGENSLQELKSLGAKTATTSSKPWRGLASNPPFHSVFR